MQIRGAWIDRVETQQVMSALATAGAKALFVGGCVRNALLGTPVNDIDIATDALPEQVMKIAEAAGLKVIPTGIEHGTVTVVSGKVPHEITTFRKDIETDGRRAVVSFSSEIADDARRRDFTMNALYADANGKVLDPLDGLKDLLAGRVRFIEDASARIKEDTLRILRFFRFFAWYGHPEQGLDAQGLAAVSSNLEGLDTLSRERVGAEFRKLLTAPNPAPAVGAMMQAGVLTRVLPGADNRSLASLVDFDARFPADPIRRLAVIGGQNADECLRLSKAETRQLSLLRLKAGNTLSAKILGYRHGASAAIDIVLIRAASLGVHPPQNFATNAALGASLVFPLKAADLMPEYQGVELGAKLKELEEIWISSGFSLSKAQLLR